MTFISSVLLKRVWPCDNNVENGRDCVMILVEFLNDHPLENTASALILRPDILYYLGDNSEKLAQCSSLYGPVFRTAGISVEIRTRRFDFGRMREELEHLQADLQSAAPDEEIYVDVLGGSEAALIACGRLLEKPGTENHVSLKLIYPDLLHRKILDAVAGDELETGASLPPAELTVDNFVRLFDGITLCPDQTVSEIFEDADTRRAIIKIWETARRIKTRVWQDYTLGTATDRNMRRMRNFLDQSGADRETIESDAFDRNVLPNILGKSGNLLEMYTASMVYETMEKVGIPHRVWQSVTLDWNGLPVNQEPDPSANVYNEVDVMTFAGYRPVFISCKLGVFGRDELFMLNSVTKRFGGKYARMAVIKSGLITSDPQGRELVQRAESMGITIIQDVKNMSIETFGELLFRMIYL